MSLHKLLFRNCISSIVPSGLPVLNIDLHSCQTLSSDSTGPQTSQQSPSSSHDTSRSRSRSPQSNSSRSASASAAQHTHDSHCSTTLNISAGGASGIANDVCARCRRHDEQNVSAHAAGAVECPHARCLDCELFERRNRHTHTRHVLRQWLQEGRQQAVERTIDRDEARDTSKDLKAQTNQKTRERLAESKTLEESRPKVGANKQRAEGASEEPNFNAVMSREHVRSEQSAFENGVAHQHSKSLNQSNSNLAFGGATRSTSREPQSYSDTGISTQSPEEHQDAVSDISVQSTESASSLRRQQSDADKSLGQYGVQVIQSASPPITPAQAASMNQIAQMHNQLLLSMLRLGQCAVPCAKQQSPTAQKQGPLSMPQPSCVPLNAVPAHLPSPPPLYRFADSEMSRAHNPVEPTAQLTNWPAIPTRGTTASRSNRQVHNECLSSGPIRASTNWNAPVQRSPQVAASLPAEEPPLSAGCSTARQKPQVLPYQPPHDVPVNCVGREQWPKTRGATVLGANDVRATVGREPVMWLGEHPASNEKYLYFCVPYAEVQQPTRVPQLLSSAAARSPQKTHGTDNNLLPTTSSTSSLVQQLALQPTPGLKSTPEAQSLMIHKGEFNNEDGEAALLIADAANIKSEPSTAPISSLKTSLSSLSQVTAQAVTNCSELKRALPADPHPEVPPPKHSRGPLSPYTLPPLSPISPASTPATAAQKHFHTSSGDGASAAESQMSACSSAPFFVPNAMQTRFNAPVAAPDFFISPRLAYMFGARAPNPIPHPPHTIQQCPIPISTPAGTHCSSVPPMWVSPAASGISNRARAGGRLKKRSDSTKPEPGPAAHKKSSTQQPPRNPGMQSTTCNGDPSTSASSVGPAAASIRHPQPLITPEKIEAYARNLLAEMRARLSASQQMPPAENSLPVNDERLTPGQNSLLVPVPYNFCACYSQFKGQNVNQ